MASDYLLENVQPNVKIVVQVGGDLTIEGHADSDFMARGDDPVVNVENDRTRITVNCTGDCRLDVPDGAQISITSVGGDAIITDITDFITIISVGGDLTLRDVSDVQLTSVGGDLVVKRATGNIQLNSVGGDAAFVKIEGNISANSVGAEVLVNNVNGNCQISNVGEDLVLNTSFAVGTLFSFGVGGEVVADVSSDANVRVEFPDYVEAKVAIPGAASEQTVGWNAVVVGNGSAVLHFDRVGQELTLSSGGANEMRDTQEFTFPDDLNNLGDLINARIQEQMGTLNKHLNREAERMNHQAARFTREAERMAREAQRKAEKVKNKSFGKRGGWEFNWTWPNEPSPRGEKEKRTAEPVSNEERLAILRMVENKQITVEEAEKLLSALEGR